MQYLFIISLYFLYFSILLNLNLNKMRTLYLVLQITFQFSGIFIINNVSFIVFDFHDLSHFIFKTEVRFKFGFLKPKTGLLKKTNLTSLTLTSLYDFITPVSLHR